MRTDMTKLTVAFRNCANAPIASPGLHILLTADYAKLDTVQVSVPDSGALNVLFRVETTAFSTDCTHLILFKV
jgi:hypothetical protein